MVFNLESTLIENIPAFPDIAIWGCIFAFLEPIWHIWHHWYTRCNLKTYAVRFSMWQVIFRPNFRLIEQHLVLVWLIYIYFWLYLEKYFAEIISGQTCNAPNAPKISSLIIRICMKLNLGYRLQYYDILDISNLRGDMGPPPHTPEIEIFNVALELASLVQIHSLI